jgi:hypothetical protein
VKAHSSATILGQQGTEAEPGRLGVLRLTYSPANRTMPQKVPNVSIYDEEPGNYMILSRTLQMDFAEFSFRALR